MKTKILILLKTFDGGTGTFVSDLLTIKNKISFKVACLEKSNTKGTKNIYFFANNELYPDQYVVSGKLIMRLYREILWFQEICKAYRPDIILTIDAHCLLLATVCKLFLDSKIKLIATIHNNLEAVVNHKAPLYLKTLINKLISMALNRADKTICVSKGLAKNLFIKYKLHTEPQVIYYGLSNKYANNIAQKPKNLVDSKKRIILSVGRFVAQKDFATIIRAFSLLVKHKNNSELWLVGDGPQKQELINLVSKLKIIDKVKFLGWKQELLSIYRKADIFVFASNWEGFGYVILEAMSQGLPVIATDTKFGPREIIKRNKNGLLVSKHNYKKLTDATILVLNTTNNYQKFSIKSLERSVWFSLANMKTQYKKLFSILKYEGFN